VNRHRPYRRSGTPRIAAWPWASHRSTTHAGRCRWSLMPVQTTTRGAGHEHPWWPCVWQRRADAGVVARDADPTWLLLQGARDGVYALCGEVVATAVRCRTSTTPTTACFTARRPRGAPGTTRPATPPSARQEVACRMPHSLRWAVIRLAGLVAASLPHPDNDRAFEHITDPVGLFRCHAAWAKSRRCRWVVRVRSRGWPRHQASSRMRLTAVAAMACSRRTLGRPV
jgi:hypothetical protein